MTPDVGMLEFYILFYPRMSWGDLRLVSVYADLTWPDSWEVISGDICAGDAGAFNEEFPLRLEWPDGIPMPESSTMWLLARLVMDVKEPGRLGFANPSANEVHLTVDGEPFVSWAAGCHAEVGVECDYTIQVCGHSGSCFYEFEQPELLLNAPSGGTAEGAVALNPGPYCPSPFVIDTRASWATAKLEDDLLRVWANAAGLKEGVYNTSIEVENFDRARCLPVVFTVTETSSVPDDGGLLEHRVTWGKLKSGYRPYLAGSTP
jgi:hypothetical protein